jgi:hypothetical protein
MRLNLFVCALGAALTAVVYVYLGEVAGWCFAIGIGVGAAVGWVEAKTRPRDAA